MLNSVIKRQRVSHIKMISKLQNQVVKRIMNKLKTSFIFTDKHKQTIAKFGSVDHALVRKDVKVETEYSWDFLFDDMRYRYQGKLAVGVGKQYFEIPAGMPDHGIMISKIDY